MNVCRLCARMCTTGQATVDISSPFEGIIHELMFKAGDVVPTGSIMCSIDAIADKSDDGAKSSSAADASAGDHAAAAAAPSTASSTPSSSASSASTRGKALASPAVRRVTRENNVDIAKVRSPRSGVC